MLRSALLHLIINKGFIMSVYQYLLFADGSVVSEEDFSDDPDFSFVDVVDVPVEVVNFIQERFCRGCLLKSESSS